MSKTAAYELILKLLDDKAISGEEAIVLLEAIGASITYEYPRFPYGYKPYDSFTNQNSRIYKK